MTLSIKSVFAGLAWLTMASTINSEHTIKKVGSPERVVVSKDKNVQFGSGVESYQLPVLVYSQNTTYIDISICIRPEKQCNFTFFPRDNSTVEVKTIKQFGDDDENKVIFIWDEERKVGKNSKFSGSSRKFATMISTIDMNTCTNTKNLEFPSDPSVMNNQISVVLFKRSFDVVQSKNGVVSLTSFDVDGNQIDSESQLPIPSSSWYSIHPVSSELHAMGYFIIENTSGGQVLTLFASHGWRNKRLMEFSSLEIKTLSEILLYSICWTSNGPNDNVLVNCKQFDHHGYEKYSSQGHFEFDRLVDVTSLRGGGVALFAWNYNENTLYVVEMRPRRQHKIWSYYIEREIGNARVINFDEFDYTFILAYEDSTIVHHGKNLEQSVELQKFSLSSYEA